MKDYPYGSQMEKESRDIVIAVRLFDMGSTIQWWLSEYDPQSKVAFGYVTGFVENEWGTIPLQELEELGFIVEFNDSDSFVEVPRVVIDNDFKPTRFPELSFHKKHSD